MFRVRLSILLLVLLAAGCARQAFVRGALTEKERKEYVDYNGALIALRLQQPFMEGIADTGMSREMIVYLFGPPDRTESERYGITWSSVPRPAPPLSDMRDSIWVYFGSDSVTVSRGLVFQGDTVARITGNAHK